MSDFVIGAAIVGIGTSMPELVVSFFGAIKGNADVAIGNVVGSNIFNVLGILGVTALFFPIAINKQNMTFDIPLCIAVSVLVTLLAFNFFDGTPAVLGRLDGWVLILLFAGFMWYSFARDKKEPTPNPSLEGRETEQTPLTPLWWAIAKGIGGLAVLISGQAFLHILVNVDIGPMTGQTLPLISHGSSAFLVFCVAFGIMLSISRLAKKKIENAEMLTENAKNDIEANIEAAEKSA